MLFVIKDLDELVAGRASRERFRGDGNCHRQNQALGVKSGRNEENRPEMWEIREVLRKHPWC
jgi:hypothetical protein